jgi:hypothetical protein
METREEFRFDGDRFYQSIRMLDPAAGQATSSLDPAVEADRRDRDLNRERFFCWDGQRYTRYYRSSGHAVIVENQNQTPVELFGPFSAGIIPWGCGDYIAPVLLSYERSAVRFLENGQERIRLTILNPDIQPLMHMVFVLDPARDYAALSYSMENSMAAIRNTYSDYVSIDGRWVPRKIMIERYDKRSGSDVLISYEDWWFEEIIKEVPSDEAFVVTLDNETLIELTVAENRHTLLYEFSDHADLQSLLEQKTRFAAESEGMVQNCATAAAWHIARRFSRSVSSRDLESLVDKQTLQTSVYSLRQILEGTGLYCSAVIAELEDLKKYDACVALVHLSDSNHYVVLDHIDKDHVWMIDLTSRKFYWKKEVGNFLESWKDQIVLLISDDPRNLPVNLQTLTIAQQMEVRGGNFPTYSCTEQIQTTERVLCPQPSGGFFCFGVYYKIWERYGCKEDVNGGICEGRGMLGYEYSPCINNPYSYGSCTITWKWVKRQIRACM